MKSSCKRAELRCRRLGSASLRETDHRRVSGYSSFSVTATNLSCLRVRGPRGDVVHWLANVEYMYHLVVPVGGTTFSSFST